ncbi:Protein phosphatase 1B [Sparganum proliferum]
MPLSLAYILTSLLLVDLICRLMGALLDTPRTEKFNESGAGNNLRYGLSSMQGWRVSMEDAHCAITQLPGNLKDWSFFAVFDGHAGALVSELCASELLKCIVGTEEFKRIDPDLAPSIPEIQQGIREGFLALDERLRNLPEIASGEDRSGSTAICVLITPNHIFFANCGDSRAILISDGSVSFATTDHKPVHPAEKERIQKAGGSVIIQRVNGSLAVSRSLGDYSYKTDRDLPPTQQLISPEPEITVIDRKKASDQMIVLACDGIWDVLSNENLCELLLERAQRLDDLSKVCDEAIDYCLYKGSSDNMSIVLVAFDPAPKVDPSLKAEDEKLERALEALTNEYLEKEGCPQTTKIDHLLAHLQNVCDLPLPPHGIYCKGGLVQRILDAYKAKHADGSSNRSDVEDSRISSIQKLLGAYRVPPHIGVTAAVASVEKQVPDGRVNGSLQLRRCGLLRPSIPLFWLNFVKPWCPIFQHKCTHDKDSFAATGCKSGFVLPCARFNAV